MEGEAIVSCLTGAQIVAFGGTRCRDIEGGGLVIDFIPAGEADTKRAVFAFNENGMWLAFEGSQTRGAYRLDGDFTLTFCLGCNRVLDVKDDAANFLESVA